MLPADSRPSSSIVHDVLIVGAGPCGLAVAARLFESCPSALFTDEEHRRFHWIRSHGHRMSIKERKSKKVCPARHASGDPVRPSILVLDETSNKWMAKWNHLFKTYCISHLRSPMFWHVDPLDRDAMLAWAHFEGREKELRELKGAVGTELSKHARKKMTRNKQAIDDSPIDQRDKHDYYAPSVPFFFDHCEHVIKRYSLSQDCMLEQGRVSDISYDYVDLPDQDVEPDKKLFTVTTEKCEVHYARYVVLAVGAAGKPEIPPAVLARSNVAKDEIPPQMCHSMLIKDFPHQIVRDRIRAGRQTNLLIVGGGLTSAQLVDLAIKRGVSKVYLVTRGPWRIRLFDVGLEWMGKYRNKPQAAFWLLDNDADRSKRILEARGGGSIPSYWIKILDAHTKSGKLVRKDFTKLDTPDSELRYDAEKKMWNVRTDPPLPGGTQMVDYIYFATGVQSDAGTVPFLNTMREQHPIKFEAGFPCITDHMMWADNVPLFVTGRMAALRLGPAAPNLGGARAGAERIAWQIESLLEKRGKTEEELAVKSDGKWEYFTGSGNQFTCLQDENE